jgi:hypothetical protein
VPALVVIALAASASPANANTAAQEGGAISGRVRALEEIAQRQSARIAGYLHRLSPHPLKLLVGYATNARVPISVTIALDRENGDLTLTGPYCQIAVNEDYFATITPEQKEEVLAHEVFHCYEHEIAPGFLSHEGKWIWEGLARWVDMTLFPNTTSNKSLKSLSYYYDTPSTSLPERDHDPETGHDGVGFWAHVQDVTGDLWLRIPEILKAGLGFNTRAAVGAAVPDEVSLLQSWGSSAFDLRGQNSNWLMSGPLADYFPTTHVPTEVGSSISIQLASYSTAQLNLNPRLDEPLIEIKLQTTTHGRFGVENNYVDHEITEKTFCSYEDLSMCECPKGDVSTLPQLTPLPHEPKLGLGNGSDLGGADILYFSAQGSGYCHPAACDASASIAVRAPPLLQPLSGLARGRPAGHSEGHISATSGCPSDTTASSFGDPHLFGFGEVGLEFQAAGEFTLLKSTSTHDLEVQARQQPEPETSTVSVDTAVAMRVGRTIVEVHRPFGTDPFMQGPTVLVDHRVTRANRVRLAGGGLLERRNMYKYPGVKVRWHDGTYVEIFENLEGISLLVTVAPDRLGHLTGLLGDAGDTLIQEFRGREGRPYSPTALENDQEIVDRRYGASWRISQRESLFTYARHKNTRSYTIANFPKKPFNEGDVPLAKALHAEALCRAAGSTNLALLQDCEYDILASGKTGYAEGDALVQSVLAPGPTSTSTPPATPPASPGPSGPPAPTPIDLGAGGNPPAVAYDPGSGDTYVVWANAAGGAIELCAVSPGSNSCNGGAGPRELSDPLAAQGGSNPSYEHPRVVVLPSGTVVVVAALEGASTSAEPGGYTGVHSGVVAWSSPAGGGSFAVEDGGRFLASDLSGAGEMPGEGAVALSATEIAVYGNRYPFGSGFTDFAPGTPAPPSTPLADNTGDYGDQAVAYGAQQLASVPGPGAGQYTVVAVGGAGVTPLGCPSGSGPASGYGVAVGTPKQLAEKSWASQYFKPFACLAAGPALAGGGPGGGSIGALDEEGAGLLGTGADGIYYRRFEPSTSTFSGPVLVSEETSLASLGVEQLSLSQDSAGGVYAAWNDARGLVLAYSSNGGSSWQPPLPSGLNSYPGFNASSAVVAGIGGGRAAIAYKAGGQEYLDLTG